MLEYRYAAPFACALAIDPGFRRWVLARTKFEGFADTATLLAEQMLAKRSPGTRTWWRSHYHRKCSCIGCSDQETDLLAIFETTAGGRFALHIEVKHPADGFESNGRQAEAYAARAECWSTPGKTPDRVLPHQDADTVLFCSSKRLQEFAPHAAHFGATILIEDVQRLFPHATAPAADSARATVVPAKPGRVAAHD